MFLFKQNFQRKYVLNNKHDQLLHYIKIAIYYLRDKNDILSV